jgi:hypothetical protein
MLSVRRPLAFSDKESTYEDVEVPIEAIMPRRPRVVARMLPITRCSPSERQMEFKAEKKRGEKDEKLICCQ